jgi:hypothetical protein
MSASPAVVDTSTRLLTLMREPIVPDVGVHPGVSFPTYLGWDAASNSRLTTIRRSPAHLKAEMEQPTDTAALLLGRACHSAILEPDDFARKYLLAERCEAKKKTDGKRCSNPGTIYSGTDGWMCGVHGGEFQNAPGVVVLTASDYEAAVNVRDAVWSHPARKLLPAQSGRELSIAWNDEGTGVRCKARLDGYEPSIFAGLVVDIKTTRDASKHAFMRSIWDYGYHRQGALYVEGCNAVGMDARSFTIIAVEKERPYGIMVYPLSEAYLDGGATLLRPLLARYAECVTTGEWPGYPGEPVDAHPPDWGWSKIEEEVNG